MARGPVRAAPSAWARLSMDPVERRLAEALRTRSIDVHFQPIVDLASHRPAGAEALARWHDVQLGQVPPPRFVAAAERTGLISELGRQVLADAAAVAASWEALPTALVIDVNVSPVELRDPGFVDGVASAVELAGLAPGRLCLELTETAAVEDLVRTSRTLAALRDLGVRIALDDFGTGYSSLTVMRELPVDLVKMDRSFVAHLTTDTRATVLTRLIVDAAHAMGMAVCAEGVETPEQAAQLAALGCDLAQGWLYAPALARDDPRLRLELGEPLAPEVDEDARSDAVTGADDLVFVTSAAGTLEFVSAAALPVLGRPSSALVGTPLTDHLEPVGASAMPTDGTHRMVTRRAGADGPRWLEVAVRTSFDREGRPWRVVGVGRDVTAVVRTENQLAESERRFRRAFDEAPIGMAMTRLDGSFLRVNTAFAAMLGMEPGEVMGSTVAELTLAEDRVADEANLAEVRSGTAQVHDVVKRYRHRDGSAVRAFVRAAVVDVPGGESYILAHVLPRP